MTDDVLEPQPAGIPLPSPSAVSAPYWAGCAAGELLYLRCTVCGEILMPPTARVCWRCTGTDLEWEPSTGRGRLRSWTVVWRPPSPSFQVPYAPAIVELDEGFDHVTAIIGCRPSELRADLPVEVAFEPAGPEVWLPYFRPAG